ncbi:MAG: zf-HC2 domain-containing protein [Chloroflexi bacterium]|nr:zf-HC2 domain-containing protein [Chloroflexota bacterium]
MNIKGFFQWVRNGFRKPESLSDEVVQGFVRELEKVRVEDVSCDEVFKQLDEYVEKEVRDGDAARLMPLLREHLDICSDCCDEYEALLDVLEQAAQEK